MKKLGIMIIMAAVSVAAVRADTLALWNNDNLFSATRSNEVNTVGTDMTAGVLELGPGLAAPGVGNSGVSWDNALDAYLSDVATITNLARAIANNRYYSFTATPVFGKQANYTNISVRVTLDDKEAAGASVQVVLMSSVTGFTDGDEIGSFVASTPASQITDNGLINMDVSGVAALQGEPSAVEFRLYVVPTSGKQGRVALGHIFFEDGEPDVLVEGTTEAATTLPTVKLASWNNDNLSLGATGSGETNNAAAFVEAGITAGDLAQSYRWFNDLANWPNSMWALCSDLGDVTNLTSAITEDRYFNFFMKPEVGKQADYTKVSVRITLNGAWNATGNVAVDFVLMSSVTGFNPGDEIGSFTATHVLTSGNATDNGLLEMDISNVAALNDLTEEVEFRVYVVLKDGNSNRWGIGHIFFADAADDVVVEGRIEDLTSIPTATIIGWSSVSSSVMKLVVEAAGPGELYYPKATTSLNIVPWSSVAHSDDGVNDFVVTNLTYSTAEGDNKAIYVETSETVKFFGIGQE